MSDTESEIRQIARDLNDARDHHRSLSVRNVPLDRVESQLLAEEHALSAAKVMRLERDLRLAQGRYAEKK